MDPREQAIAIRKSVLREALDRYVFPAVIANPNDRIVYVNAAFTQQYEWQACEVIGLSTNILLPPDSPPETISSLRRKTEKAPFGWEGTVPLLTKSKKQCTAYVRTFALKASRETDAIFKLGILVESERVKEAETSLVGLMALNLLNARDGADQKGELPSRPRTRQDEIRWLKEMGFANKEIAAAMGISPNAVNVALFRIRQKAR